MKIVVLESKRDINGEWCTRNDRFSFANEIVNLKGDDAIRYAAAHKSAQLEMQRWQAIEPTTLFRVVDR